VTPERILVIRYSALGDVVLATSVLGPLRQRFPKASIEWVTSPTYVGLLEGLP
jgi:ADP-heptose:LPS heptosyltransferase